MARNTPTTETAESHEARAQRVAALATTLGDLRPRTHRLADAQVLVACRPEADDRQLARWVAGTFPWPEGTPGRPSRNWPNRDAR